MSEFILKTEDKEIDAKKYALTLKYTCREPLECLFSCCIQPCISNANEEQFSNLAPLSLEKKSFLAIPYEILGVKSVTSYM